MIDIEEYQKRLKDWQILHFGSSPPEWLTVGMMEELGEMAHTLLKYQQGIREHREKDVEKFKKQLADDFGDVVVYGMQVLTHFGINAEDAMRDTFEHVLKRDWTAHRLEGGDIDK